MLSQETVKQQQNASIQQNIANLIRKFAAIIQNKIRFVPARTHFIINLW